ncbi:MAG: type II secretion system protein E [candidate division WS6 bacterium GW2011_GWC1_36_11]|uniref:Type II secretion system protein E n=2 Tax=Candidatus Dojkabacteria TaxID=74243 RepID=A0A0G0FZ97_9BACT|nr:MAG: type II secretion system protein E [candidate division WS6 bacterium GW2011_GWC1_36_11]KKQ04707.1 MAG: type II secretion system protein E [candidate division WS6 bacterium GW2011_WS6_36_26]KKQ11305.1 MAG: type II secretion system protein E [candidate division WS6 bacterium GW2011_GWE1_36_69]KKQ17908.1 MAG: type II secretion system protein E [candidate division WS6 bacterium GW2011_GWF1_36_8]HAM96848.1 type II secretion system protein E [Patescibacteria group bacterium]
MITKSSLLKYFQTKGLINEDDSRKVLVERSRSQKSEEAIIREMTLANEEQIAQAKSEIFGIPYVNLKDVEIQESIISEVSVDALQKYRAVPFERNQDSVKIAMQDPFDIQATQALQRKYPAGTRILVYITTAESIGYILDRRVGETMSSEVTEALEDVEMPVTEINEDPNILSSTDLSSAPIARIVNAILQYAAISQASDIHIEPMEKKTRVRFRINGVMTERLALPSNLNPALVSRVKILSNLKIDEKRVPQDGRFPIKVNGAKIDLRVSTMPTIYGEKVVMRLLESDTSNVTLESTGMRGHAYKVYLDGLGVTNGIVLVTGPTGSGKTRTLACSLMKVNDAKVNIISLENPVEIRVPGVTQVQINPDAGLTFATGLRSVLRQDPDVVMVGEIRDQETAQLAVQASLTGHLVLSTLHTNSAAAAIPRLLDMGIEPYLLSSTIRTVAAQRLPRKICEHCVEAYPALPEVVKDIKEEMSSVPGFDVIQYLTRVAASPNTSADFNFIPRSSAFKAPEMGPDGQPILYLYRGKGCDKCGGTGYSGRIGIFEVLDITDKISRMMMETVTDKDIEKVAQEEGMLTMTEDGYLKALEGITTLEEVMRVSKE